MTRNEFIENISDFDDLLRFCSDMDCDVCDYVKEYEEYKEWIWDGIRYWDYDWEALRDWLDGLPEASRYDYVDVEDEVCALGEYEFDNYKDRVLEWAENNEVFDEDDEEETEAGENPSGGRYLFEGPVPEPENPMAAQVFNLLMLY